MSKLKSPGVTIKVTDYSNVACTTPMYLSAPRGPVMLKSPEEMDSITGEPRGTTRRMLQATGLSCVSTTARIKGTSLNRGLSNEPERV